MNISRKKEKLRKRLLEIRQNLDDRKYLEASRQIRDRLNSHSMFQQARTVHCYVSMKEKGEVDTRPLIRKILQDDKRLVVPVTDFESTKLIHHELNSVEELRTNKWGVPEPRVEQPVDPSQLDLVIVPMVGGDEQRNRIGYGKGFYDRFLSKTDCPTIGLCFEDCIVEEIPVESFDVSLTAIITEKRVI